MRTYGKVWFSPGSKDKDTDSEWHITGEPHLILKLKRVFARVHKGQHGSVRLNDTDEVRRDIVWFMDRYPISIIKKEARLLNEGARRHKDKILRLEEIVDPNYQAIGFELALPAREYQKTAATVALTQSHLLLADEVGIGKTVSAICMMTDERTLPALVVTLSGVMPDQWMKEINRFAPTLNVHIAKKGQSYPLPKSRGRGPDVIVMNYHKLNGWADTLAGWAKLVIFDEVQELRHSTSLKYDAAYHVAEKANFRIGLSATPIYNYGGEIFNVMDVLAPGQLGTYSEFTNEWCGTYGQHKTLNNARAFGSYLREHFLLLRRTRKDVKRELPSMSKITQRISYDEKALDDVEESARALAEIIISQAETRRGELRDASQELSWKLRAATGVGKAPHVASFIRMLTEANEKVIVYCWHRAVYKILMDTLDDLKPVMFTGSESPKAKMEAKRKFMEGETDVILMSLRAGAGVDGFQNVCRTVVFAELDWSPGIHEQNIGRVDRDGQTDPVTAYFLVSDGGADPVIAERLGLKSEQVDGVRDPDLDTFEKLDTQTGRSKALAEHYLESLKRKRRKRPLKISEPKVESAQVGNQ